MKKIFAPNLREGTYNFREEIYNYAGKVNETIFHIASGITYPDSSYEVYRANANCYTIEYIYDGICIIQNGKKTYRASKGDIFILHPNKVQHYYSHKQKPCKKIWITIDSNLDLISHLITDYGLSNKIIISGINTPLHLKRILNCMKNQSRNISRKLEILIFLQIAEMSDYIKKTEFREYTVAESIKLYMDKNPNAKITIKDLCIHTSYGRTQLTNIFKTAYNMTPMEYFKQLKYQTACTLLNQTSLSISEIAQRLSFNDAQHFAKFFKNRSGVTPSKYRKTY